MNQIDSDRLKKIEKDIRDFYRHQSWLVRLYQKIKFKICPLLPLESYFPPEGTILDLGCGQGLFSLILYLGSPKRKIIGVDLDDIKIEKAKELVGSIQNLSFTRQDIIQDDYPAVDAVALIDVLYLLPYETHLHIFKKVNDCLPPHGLFLLKEMDTRPRWKYLWNILQETLAVKIIGFTLGSRFYFRSQKDMLLLLNQAGFQTKVINLHQGYWYPHIAYLCHKKT